MKNNRLEAHKTSSILNKKNSSLNFKQAISKQFSKKSNITSKPSKDKPLKAKKKINKNESKDIIKNQIKPFLTKNEIPTNSKQKNSEKIRNLLKYANNNQLLVSKSNLNNKKLKNKSTSNLCAPTPLKGLKTVMKPKKNENLETNKSPQLNDFINDNIEINKEFNNNQNILKTNLAFLIAKNQNYDDDSIFLNINESYLDYINNNQLTNGKKINTNGTDKNKNELISDDYSIKNNNLDNNDTSTLINSIININKFLTNEENHKVINKANVINDKNKKSKPRKVYENQLLKTNQDLIKTKEEDQQINYNNENDKNINNIINNKNSINNNINSNYQREILNKVMKSKYAFSVKKPLKTNLLKKRKFLSLEDIYEDNNCINTDLCFNTHSPKITINNEIIKNFQFSPNVYNENKTLFNIENDLTNVKNKNNKKERIKVSKAKKYKLSHDNIKNKLMNDNNKNKEEAYEKSTKSNNTNSTSSNKTNSNKTNKTNSHKNNDNSQNNNENNNAEKIKEFNLINENVNNLMNNIDINLNIDNKNLNYNIFDDDFYNHKVDYQSNNENNFNKEDKSHLNKYINYVDKFTNKKNKKHKVSHNSSCHFIYPSLIVNNKYNTVVNQEKNNMNISNIEQINNEYLFTQEDDDNNNKIQEIKIKLKNPSNLKLNNSNQNINVLNVQNSTINICKNKYNIITTKSDENIMNNNFRKEYKNRSINNSLRNKISNETFIYSYKSPSHRPYFQRNHFEKNEKNRLNNSNDRIMNKDIYIKQIFNNKSRFKIQNEKNRINKSKHSIHQLLKTEINKFNHTKKFANKNELNIKMLPLINNFQTPELEYINSENDNIYNELNYKIKENNKKVLNTANNFFKTNNNLENNKNKSPKIYIKPSKYIFKKNIPQNNEIYNPPDSQNQGNIFFPQQEDNSSLIISYRNNKLNKKNDNYFNDIEFINNEKISEKINKNLILYQINQTRVKAKAYIKKNKNIYHKNNNSKLKIKVKNRVINSDNPRITKYYSYFMSRTQIIKRPCYISKHSKKPKYLPLCKRSFMTKIIYKYIKRVKTDICYIDKKIKINNSNAAIQKEKNILDKQENIIKANILDFSLDQNKETIDNNNIFINNNRIINNVHHNKEYQESLGEINLSFSNEDINICKYRENTIEAVFNELNNVNAINNDSEIKVTFGQENINCNYNYDISTEGRIINDSFNGIKNKQIQKNIIYKRDEILGKNKKEKITSVIVYDNEEQNEDIKIDFENEKEDKFQTNHEKVEEGSLNLNQNDENNSLILNITNKEGINSKNRKTINSKDIIDFTEKLENIFDKKKNNTDNEKKAIFKDVNVYCSNFNILDNKDYKFPYLNNENDFINLIGPKCRTYAPKRNKYLEILSNNDLTPLNRLELRINNENNHFKQNLNNIENNSINEIDSEDENNITFSQDKITNSQKINIEKEIIINNNIENELNYLLNIISIGNFPIILNKLINIILDSNEKIFEQNKFIFIELIIKRSIFDLKYLLLYSILIKNINSKIIKKAQIDDKNLINIIKSSLQKKFNDYIYVENDSTHDYFKKKIFGIIECITSFIYFDIINTEIGIDYLNKLYNIYLNEQNNDIKNIYLNIILLFIDKLGKILYIRNDISNITNLNNFINEKIKTILDNENDFPHGIINKIKKIIIRKENDWKLSNYEDFQINKYKNLIKLNEKDFNNEEEYNEIKLNNNLDIKNDKNMNDFFITNNIDYEIYIIIKDNLINSNLNNNITIEKTNTFTLNYNLNLYIIIRYYIEICIDYVNTPSLINKCNNYINNIIEKYSIKENKIEDINNKIVDLILNIDYIIMDNKYMYQIMGYLLYSLINYEFYKIEDLNNFIGKDETTLINIALVIKYIIIYCNKDFDGDEYKKQILEEFRQTDLFKVNQNLFDTYVINDPLL